MPRTLAEVLGGDDYEAGVAVGRTQAAWAILAVLVRSGVEHDPAEILRAAGVPGSS